MVNVMIATEPCPSQTAYNKARKLARDAAKNDSWMLPVPDDHEVTDYGDFTQAHEESWEQTDHFDHYYRIALMDLADQQAKRFNIEKAISWEAWYYYLFAPLKDTFWEEWETKINLYEQWTAYRDMEGRQKVRG